MEQPAVRWGEDAIAAAFGHADSHVSDVLEAASGVQFADAKTQAEVSISLQQILHAIDKWGLFSDSPHYVDALRRAVTNGVVVQRTARAKEIAA